MPSRANPYFVGNTNTYGSRGLSPGYSGRSYGGVSIATPLAELASGLIGAAAYDPAADPRRAAARLDNLKAQEIEDRNTVLGQVAGMALDPYTHINDIQRNLVTYGRVDPEKAAQYALNVEVMRQRGSDRSMDDALRDVSLLEVAAGRSGGSTFAGSTFKERMAPTEVIENGAPVLRPAQDSYGATPVLTKDKVTGTMLSELAADNLLSNEEQKQATGARLPQETPYNYFRTDPITGKVTESGSSPRPPSGAGVTVFTGQVQPDNVGGLRPTVQAGIQENQISLGGFDQTLSTLESMSDDPTNFGLAGRAKDVAAQGAAMARNLGQLLGKDYSQVVSDIANAPFVDDEGRPAQVDLGQFDPRIHGLRSFAALAAYQGAASLAKQEGRAVALAELENFKNIVGDPLSPLMDRQKFLSGMNMLRQEVRRRYDANKAALEGRAPAPGVPAGATPMAKPRIKIDLNGNIVQ